jgi:hypothetical protein
MAKRGTICWVQLIEKAIANGPDEGSGDVVTVPTLWTPPDAMEGVSNDVASAICREIAKGRYRRDARSGTAWAGHLVGQQLHFVDTGTKVGKLRATTVIEQLIKKGVLAVDIEYDDNRNPKMYVVQGLGASKGSPGTKKGRSS